VFDATMARRKQEHLFRKPTLLTVTDDPVPPHSPSMLLEMIPKSYDRLRARDRRRLWLPHGKCLHDFRGFQGLSVTAWRCRTRVLDFLFFHRPERWKGYPRNEHSTVESYLLRVNQANGRPGDRRAVVH